MQGDVLGIYTSDGDLITAYDYDAWGNCTATNYIAEYSLIGEINPIRYRGYYYDVETGFYYVSSRYYDPEIGRWINVDSQLNTSLGILGLNLFSYCLNNPVNMVDYGGNKPGDLFNTMDEAARDAATYLGALSFENGWEYITVIYSVNKTEKTYKTVTKTYKFLWWSWTRTSTRIIKTKVKKYTYKTVRTDKDPWGVSIPKAPLFRKRLATVHTHPMGSGLGITRFSPGDIETADDMGLVDYVYGPNGELRKYDPSTEEDILLFSDLPASVKTPWLD